MQSRGPNIKDRDGWWESVKLICAISTSWWWRLLYSILKMYCDIILHFCALSRLYRFYKLKTFLVSNFNHNCVCVCVELALDFNTSQSTTWHLLKKIRKGSKLGIWLPHTLNEKNEKDQIFIAKNLLSRQRNYQFLKNVITDDEKCVFCDNVQWKKVVDWQG